MTVMQQQKIITIKIVGKFNLSLISASNQANDYSVKIELQTKGHVHTERRKVVLTSADFLTIY